MPVLKRQDIDRNIRAPHEKAYKAQLKKALHDPMVTPEVKEHFNRKPK